MKTTLRLSIIGCLIITLSVSRSKGQAVKPLKVNDTLPDLEISHLVRERTVPLRTKTLYNDGLLIVNFWATWCVPCVQEMTFLAGEVEKYKGRLQVINIGYEPKAVVAAFLKAHPEIAKSNLEITTDDKVWIKRFFHQALPHNVWVDRNGIVKSITGGEEVTDENIRRLLDEQSTTMHQKIELPFNAFNPMPVPDSLIEYRSVFNKYLPGVTLSGSVIDSHGWGRPSMKRFFEYNSLITGLFWDAYEMPGDYNYKNVHDFIEVRTADSSRYFWPGAESETGRHFRDYHGISQTEWARANTYSYELRTPTALSDGVFFDKVISELEFNLKVKTWKEFKRTDCTVVTIQSQKKHIKSFNPNGQQSIVADGNKIIVSNTPMSSFLRWLSEKLRTEYLNGITPYIDETDLNGPVSFELDIGGTLNTKRREDIENCMSEQFGFKFKKEKRLYPILIIKDL